MGVFMSIKEIKNITKDNFSKYGVVIDSKPEFIDGKFEVLISEKNYGWRIAIYEYIRKGTKKLENHPTSKESFEPLIGVSLLIVAENPRPSEFEVFLLDKPICLYEGVWHQVLSLSEVAQVKITENYDVNSEFYEFDEEIIPVIIEK